MKMKHWAVLLALTLGATGCATEWDVKAYDLSGKLVYSDTLVNHYGSSNLTTPEGKRVLITNATIVMEEQ